MIRIRLLGQVELLRSDGGAVVLGAAKRRAVLAALAGQLGTVVPGERLIDVVWQGAAPRTAKAALQGHIAQLRKSLGDGVELVTRSPGYQLLADRSLLDLTRFEDLLVAARGATDAAAVELLREALALRRGPVLADVPLESLRRELAVRADESAVAATEDLATRLHRLGRAEESVAPLRSAVELRPLREPLVRLLVLALHGAGRQADALEVYHATRQRLADELGLDPGRALRQAFHTVLEVDERPAAAPVPAQLPRPLTGFTGRTRELDRLGAGPPADGAVRVLVGAAGIGKTALALRWAHRVAARFPDGQLFADLRGFGAGAATEPGRVLAGFLRALGVPDDAVPPEVEQRAALYRSLLAGRSVLVLLDDARSAAQVRPLLPGAPGCAVLVTSRSRLDDLAVTEGAVRIPVPALELPEAIALLERVLGAERVAAEPDAAAELAESCDRSPLALRIAATRFDQGTVRAAADALAAEQHRLDRLALPEAGPVVRSALESSYRELDAPSGRMFRLLGAHPGPEIDGAAATALAGATAPEARRALQKLMALHLLRETGPDRYARDELVRLAAASLDESGAGERDLAVARLLEHYASTAAGAHRSLADRFWWSPDLTADQLPSPGSGLRYFRTEEHNLHHALRLARAEGHHDLVWRLASSLERFHHHVGDLHGQAEILRSGLVAARESGESRAVMRFHLRLGINFAEREQVGGALLHGEQAVRLSRGDRHDECRALLGLGSFQLAARRPPAAMASVSAAAEIARSVDDQVAESTAMIITALARHELGRRAEAFHALRDSVGLLTDETERAPTSGLLLVIGSTLHHYEQHEQALGLFHRGLDTAAELDDVVYQARHHRSIAITLHRMRGRSAATPHLIRAGRLYSKIRLPRDHARDELSGE
ncbi:BTAD domain-containing putative transcriptional regulator [Saccharopolyspora sp. NPDC002578]